MPSTLCQTSEGLTDVVLEPGTFYAVACDPAERFLHTQAGAEAASTDTKSDKTCLDEQLTQMPWNLLCARPQRSQRC